MSWTFWSLFIHFFSGNFWNKAYSLLLSSEPFWCLVNILYIHKVVLLWLVWTWMIYKPLCVLGIVWFMIFLKLFFPGICSLLEFMKFHPVDISSRGCFTDFWSSVSASHSFPALALKILAQSASLNSVLCLFNSKKLLDSLFPSQLCCLEIVSRQKARAFLGFPSLSDRAQFFADCHPVFENCHLTVVWFSRFLQ